MQTQLKADRDDVWESHVGSKNLVLNGSPDPAREGIPLRGDMRRPIVKYEYRDYQYVKVGVWRRCGRLPVYYGRLLLLENALGQGRTDCISLIDAYDT